MNLRTIYIAIGPLAVFAIFFASCSSSQKIKNGDQAFAQKSYSLAATLYQSELGKVTDPKKKAAKIFKIRKKATAIAVMLKRQSTGMKPRFRPDTTQ